MTPRVSLLTPAYKPEHFAPCLQSALAQTLTDFEYVICDDSPDDAIGDLVRCLAGADPRVRYVRNRARLGGRRNYLQCFELARGRHIKFLNDDDLLAPDCLARLSACLDARPDVALATSYRQLIDAAGAPLPDQPFNRPLVREDSVLDGRGLLDLMLRAQVNVVGEPTTVMFRRADLAGNHPHIMSFAGKPARRNGDTFMWASLLAKGDAAYFVAPLSRFRQHGRQVQQDPSFVAEAQLAWRELVVDAAAAGVFDPAQPRPLGARPLDPLLAIVRERLDAILARARALAAAGEVEAAELDLREILASDPRCCDARSDLGCLLWQQGAAELAEAAWRRALATDPDHLDATVNLAHALLAGGRAAAAAELCAVHAARSPWAGEVVQLLAQARRAALEAKAMP